MLKMLPFVTLFSQRICICIVYEHNTYNISNCIICAILSSVRHTHRTDLPKYYRQYTCIGLHELSLLLKVSKSTLGMQ